jgi:hypothetical protein
MCARAANRFPYSLFARHHESTHGARAHVRTISHALDPWSPGPYVRTCATSLVALNNLLAISDHLALPLLVSTWSLTGDHLIG